MRYHAPTDLNEALALLANGPVSVVAGGTDYFPAKPAGDHTAPILDITRIKGLRGIEQSHSGTRINAATRWSDIAKADLPAGFGGLKQAASKIGSLQIQNAGTLAGNICNASPAADGVPPLLTLDAQVELASFAGVRQLPLSDFLTGVRQTGRLENELVTALIIPPQPNHAVGAFHKHGNRAYLVISISMVAVIVGCDDAGKIDFARVAVGACSPVAQRLHQLECDMIGQPPQQVEVSSDHLSQLSPIDDVRGSGAYRKTVVAEQILRTLKQVETAHG